MRVEYWKCDKCGKEIKKFSDIATIGLTRKTFELCEECSKELYIWFTLKQARVKK
jgi:hypothetical protein